MLTFGILGPLEVRDGDRPVALGGPKQRATLAILLLGANRVISVERLADDLYAGAPPVTAVTQVQRQVSELRKALGAHAGIETRPPGYVIHLHPEQLDLHRFERGAEDAAEALRVGEADRAAALLDEALALWRGSPLADLAYEPFAQATITRLEEIRLAAVELRVDAQLALGRHVTLVPELEALVWDHPLRERFRAQLMLALYRSGRQAEALDAYRNARAALVEGFGIEPSAALHDLEHAILVQDPALDPRAGESTAARDSTRAVLVLPSSTARIALLLGLAEPLARLPEREVIAARLLDDEAGLGEATDALAAARATVGGRVRTAAFTTVDASRDAVRLATAHDVDLVLLDADRAFADDAVPRALIPLLERAPAHVGLVSGADVRWDGGNGVYIVFGGTEHDWAALELGAQLAAAAPARLRLVGTRSDPSRARGDASRLLADASLTVQRVVGIDAGPVLADRDEQGLLAVTAEATVILAGISTRWRERGVGAAARALIRRPAIPFVAVHRGTRPGVLAPRGSRTRFSWTLDG